MAGAFFQVVSLVTPIFGNDTAFPSNANPDSFFRITKPIRSGMYMFIANDSLALKQPFNASSPLGRVLVPRVIYRLARPLALDFSLAPAAPSPLVPWWSMRGYGCDAVSTPSSLDYDAEAVEMQVGCRFSLSSSLPSAG